MQPPGNCAAPTPHAPAGPSLSSSGPCCPVKHVVIEKQGGSATPAATEAIRSALRLLLLRLLSLLLLLLRLLLQSLLLLLAAPVIEVEGLTSLQLLASGEECTQLLRAALHSCSIDSNDARPGIDVLRCCSLGTIAACTPF